jgi:predicted HD superfamily hydrolase involved in NAD metabolism
MIEQIKHQVIEKLKDHPKRLKHVMGVYETACTLASIHHIDVDKAAIAALYHDYAKYDTIEEQIKHMELKMIKQYAEYPVMYHALAAAIKLEHDFNIKDQDILNAIRYHVWGRPQMSDLEKIIFISDSCEPNRAFEDACYIFETAKKDLNQAVSMAMKASIDYLKHKGLSPSEEQLIAYHSYQEVNRGETQ